LIAVHTDDPTLRRDAIAIFQAENAEYIHEEPRAA
jgi:hypothetical protein